jgi:hypothetical protein
MRAHPLRRHRRRDGPITVPKSRRLDDRTFHARAHASRASHTDAEWRQRRDGLEWFINQVIEASLSPLPREAWKG